MQAARQFAVPAEDKADERAVAKLFQDGRGFSTVMFWIAFFMCLFMVYALSSWLTKLMAMAGYSLGSALTFVLVLQRRRDDRRRAAAGSPTGSTSSTCWSACMRWRRCR